MSITMWVYTVNPITATQIYDASQEEPQNSLSSSSCGSQDCGVFDNSDPYMSLSVYVCHSPQFLDDFIGRGCNGLCSVSFATSPRVKPMLTC